MDMMEPRYHKQFLVAHLERGLATKTVKRGSQNERCRCRLLVYC